jgi:hypothetical protein
MVFTGIYLFLAFALLARAPERRRAFVDLALGRSRSAGARGPRAPGA